MHLLRVCLWKVCPMCRILRPCNFSQRWTNCMLDRYLVHLLSLEQTPNPRLLQLPLLQRQCLQAWSILVRDQCKHVSLEHIKVCQSFCMLRLFLPALHKIHAPMIYTCQEPRNISTGILREISRSVFQTNQQWRLCYDRIWKRTSNTHNQPESMHVDTAHTHNAPSLPATITTNQQFDSHFERRNSQRNIWVPIYSKHKKEKIWSACLRCVTTQLLHGHRIELQAVDALLSRHSDFYTPRMLRQWTRVHYFSQVSLEFIIFAYAYF